MEILLLVSDWGDALWQLRWRPRCARGGWRCRRTEVGAGEEALEVGGEPEGQGRVGVPTTYTTKPYVSLSTVWRGSVTNLVSRRPP